MTTEQDVSLPPRMQEAVDELQGIIRQHYPTAIFAIAHGADEPENVHLVTTVDIEDTGDVINLVMDRLLELQLEEELPLHVIPIRPLERVLTTLHQRSPHDSWVHHHKSMHLGE